MQRADNNRFLLALGANMGGGAAGNAALLRQALDRLTAGQCTLATLSGFHVTPTFPAGSGPDFVNACAAVDSALSARALLDRLHEVEAAMGRQRIRRWGPRVIDLDLLAMGDAILPDAAFLRDWMALPPARQASEAPDRLILPHPRLHERAFVLVPLAEIAPDWRHPLTGQTVAAMRDALPAEALMAVRRL